MPTLRLFRGDAVDERPLDRAVADLLAEDGVGALAAHLGGGVDAVAACDDDVEVSVRGVGAGLRVVTTWPDGTRTEEDVVAEAARPVDDIVAALHDPARPLYLREGRWYAGPASAGAELVVPARAPEQLGSPAFRAAHEVRWTYVAGAMAGGIASVDLVAAMAGAGLLAYFGAGGLPLVAVADAARRLPPGAGANLLHNPAEPDVEERTVDLYLEHGIRAVDASAYMGLTPAVVRYRLTGIHEDGGRIVVPNRVAAKVSRPEVAEPFVRPAPEKIVAELVARGALTARQAELARRVPVAEDVTCEADSGGHTDRRPLSVIVPVIRRLVDRVGAEQGYADRVRVGAAGGLGDPWSVAAAYALGAEYVMTGSVNQATVEAGTSPMVKEMLAQAGYADVALGPAPDMFELGAQVQVLARGSLYAQRAARLYEVYRSCASLDDIPPSDRARIETQILGRPIDDVWRETEAYWAHRDPREIERAGREPRHKMALAFRWYLGMTSRWARMGEGSRKRDFQVWCGPAMGAFNDWVRGSALEPLAARTVVGVARALVRGACVAERVQLARQAGPLPAAADRIVATA